MEGRRVHLGQAEVGEDLRLLSAVPDHLLLLESDAEHEGQRPWDTLPALYGAARQKRASGSIKALISDNYRRFLKGRDDRGRDQRKAQGDGAASLSSGRALARFTLVEQLKTKHVMVIGLGGVGSWAAEMLVRTGVGRVSLVDFDKVCVTNTNRQLHAKRTIGKHKASVMAERLLAINPVAQIGSDTILQRIKR